jgi:DNA-binding PadR family transcriptional regulator
MLPLRECWRFSEQAQHFWFAERSQIYPALKRMRDQRWLDTWEEPSERGPRRKVYETTAEGREELSKWLREGPHIAKTRLGFVAQTFFLGELGDYTESLSVVRRMRATWESKLADLEFVERVIREDFGEDSEWNSELLHNHMALSIGLHMLNAEIAWCDETIERLETRIRAAELELAETEG